MRRQDTHHAMLAPVATAIPARPVGVALRHGVQFAVRHLPRAGHSASGRRANIIPAVALLLAIAVTEVVTGFVGFGAGLLLHLALLTLFLTLAAVLKNQRWRALLLILALVPLLRVIDLATPLGGVLQPFWLPLTAIPFFGAVVSITNVLDLTPPSLGLQPALPESMSLECAVAMSGIGVGMIEWWILRPAPIVAWGSLPLLLLVAALLLVCTGFLEALLFQGFIQHAAGALLGSGGGILFTAGVFGLLHIGWQSPLEIVFAFGVGLYFGLVRWLTGSVLGISLGHGVAVIMLFMVLPLRLSPQLAPQALRLGGQSLIMPMLDVMGNPSVVAIFGLIVFLAAREIAGASTHPGILRWRASLTIVVVPLILMFAVIVTEKVLQVL